MISTSARAKELSNNVKKKGSIYVSDVKDR